VKRHRVLLLLPFLAWPACSTYDTTSAHSAPSNDAGPSLLDASAPDSGAVVVDASTSDADAAIAQDFSLSVALPANLLIHGGTATVSVEVIRAPGTTAAITVDLQDLPTGVTSTPTVTVAPDQTTASFTLTTSPGVALGTTVAEAHATLGTIERTTPFNVVVGSDRGLVDSTYGAGNGVAVISGDTPAFEFGPDGAIYAAIAVQNGPPQAKRFTNAGVADPGWGIGGAASATGGPTFSPARLAIDGTGRLFVAGEDQNGNVYVIRFDSTGHYEPSFQIKITPTAGQSWNVFAIAIGGDGRILILTADQGTQTENIFQYTSAGIVDANFTAPVVSQAQDYIAATIGADGNAYLAGALDKQGTLTSFDAKGTFRYPTVEDSLDAPLAAFNAVVALPDGSVFAGGYINTDTLTLNEAFAVGRFTSTGARDKTFGANGVATTKLHVDSSDTILSISSDGSSVVAVGRSVNDTIVVAMYGANGLLDPTFATSGIATMPPVLAFDDAKVVLTKTGVFVAYTTDALTVRHLIP
jgi:uncharacterized delta-60 repeat protein